MVSLYQTFHHDASDNKKRLRLFGYTFALFAFLEPITSYIAPTFNGISVFCLASQKAPSHLRAEFNRMFGGANNNQGLGLFSLSFDWCVSRSSSSDSAVLMLTSATSSLQAIHHLEVHVASSHPASQLVGRMYVKLSSNLPFPSFPDQTFPSFSTLESSDDLLPDGHRPLLRQRLGSQVASSLVDLDLPGERKVLEPVDRLPPELAHPQPDGSVRSSPVLGSSPGHLIDSLGWSVTREDYGLPRMTASYIWANLCQCAAVRRPSKLASHCKFDLTIV